MKGYEIRNCFLYLSQIELSEFDKQVRNAILRTYANLSPKNKEIEEKIKAIDERLFKGEELQKKVKEVSDLREEYQRKNDDPARQDAINKQLEDNYSDYLELEKESYQAKNDLLLEEVKVPIVRFDKETFVDGLVASKVKFRAGDIEMLDCLFKKPEEKTDKK